MATRSNALASRHWASPHFSASAHCCKSCSSVAYWACLQQGGMATLSPLGCGGGAVAAARRRRLRRGAVVAADGAAATVTQSPPTSPVPTAHALGQARHRLAASWSCDRHGPVFAICWGWLVGLWIWTDGIQRCNLGGLLCRCEVSAGHISKMRWQSSL